MSLLQILEEQQQTISEQAEIISAQSQSIRELAELILQHEDAVPDTPGLKRLRTLQGGNDENI